MTGVTGTDTSLGMDTSTDVTDPRAVLISGGARGIGRCIARGCKDLTSLELELPTQALSLTCRHRSREWAQSLHSRHR